jgi:hypothetical protein
VESGDISSLLTVPPVGFCGRHAQPECTEDLLRYGKPSSACNGPRKSYAQNVSLIEINSTSIVWWPAWHRTGKDYDIRQITVSQNLTALYLRDR